MNIKINKQQRQLLIADISLGYSCKDLGIKYNISASSVARIAKEEGAYTTRREVAENVTNLVYELNSLGKSIKEIAKAAQRTERHVSYILAKKFGNKMNPKKEKTNEDQYRCPTCKSIKLVDEFITNRITNQHSNYCRTCRTRKNRNKTTSNLETFFKYKVRNLMNSDRVNFNYTYLLDLWGQQNEKCFYTNKQLKIEETDRQKMISIDKIIPRLGYVEGNIAICSFKSNTIKLNLPLSLIKELLPDFWHSIYNFIQPDEQVLEDDLKKFYTEQIELNNLFDKNKISKTYYQIVGRSRKYNIPFDLDLEWVFKNLEIQKNRCYYTDIPLKMKWGERKFNSLSFDRIVPQNGYTRNNVILCCSGINCSKSNLGLDELKSYSPFLYNKTQEFLNASIK